MSIAARIITLSVALLLAGCAKQFYTETERATVLIEDARSAFVSGDINTGSRSVDFALERETGPAQARAYFATNPEAAAAYTYHVEQQIASLRGVQSSQQRRESLQTLRREEVLPAANTDWLNRFFDAEMTSANKSGAIPITLFDDISDLPALQLPQPRRLILDRTISRLAREPDAASRPIARMIAFYKLDDTSMEEKTLIRNALMKLKLRRSELDAVGEVFNDVAVARRNELTTTATLVVLGADRLFKDDLAQTIGIEPGIEWVAGGATVVTVEKLRHNETVQPERAQTVIYAFHEVDILKAALLMPKNASYLYELISSGSSVEYGYVVTATTGGKPIFEEVVRGTISSEGGRCQNARVQNVFGGVTPASFTANDDMLARCRGETAEGVDVLRSKVNRQIAAAVMRVPALKMIVDQR
ncbi:hypothetical protein FXN63_19885 [Pigmentiphaga aceris]|uniref:Uncharacterized protein n=1 Tax=Pigmentiphaga aceris TaxID=1940612 RepID=A0A5C0B1J1_9BURK|nr:hypothetical protein [Pigmentiphaga aceris]QEI07846.1 hypothetical protein FXN63_19885 [Pigmentiphaga aceris]